MAAFNSPSIPLPSVVVVPNNETVGGTLTVIGATTLASTLAVTGNETVSGTLGVTGATTLSSTVATGALTVTGNETVSGTLGVTGATTLSSTLGVTGVTTVAAGSAAAPSVVSVTGTSDTGVFFPAADTVAASTAGSERLRIDSSGNVGIGTSAPTQQLTVANVIQCAVDGQNGYLYFGGSSERIAANYAAHAFLFYTSGTERLRIDSDGNVGINTSAMAGKLTIQGASTTNPNSLWSYGYNATGSVDTRTGTIRNGFDNNTNYSTFWTSFRGAAGSSYKSIFGIAAGAGDVDLLTLDSSGKVGIGTTSPSYLLQVNTDSAGKPGVGGLWTVVSDERIKTDIVPADLDRCYEIVKSVPLKHFGFAPGVYTDEQIQDKHSLGWIAQDVQQVFAKAVSVKPFTLHTDIPDGTEDYEEQDFTLDQVETTTTSIQIIDGKPVQVSKTETAEHKVLLFDTVDVLDESGAVVMNGDTPLTYQMPRMVTKTRPKVRHETIEDCLDLNSGQMIAALYGCVQALMAKVEALEARG